MILMRAPFRLAIASSLLLLTITMPVSAAGPYVSVEIPRPNYGIYNVMALNQSGHVAYWSGATQGYVWDGAVVTELPGSEPIYSHSIPYGLNDSDVAVGTINYANYTQAAKWSNGALTVLNLNGLNSNQSIAFAINNSGLIAGESMVYGSGWHLFTIAPDGTLVDQGLSPADTWPPQITDMNQSGQMVIRSNGGGVYGYMWQSGTYTPLPDLDGGRFSSPMGINDAGVIVGGSFLNHTNLSAKAVVWRNGVPEALPVPEGTINSFACDINNLGQIVGYYNADANSVARPCLWDADGTFYDLPSLVQSGPTDRLSRPGDINDNGQITIWGSNTTGYLLTPIPEPATLSLLALGGLVVLRRRNVRGMYYSDSVKSPLQSSKKLNLRALLPLALAALVAVPSARANQPVILTPGFAAPSDNMRINSLGDVVVTYGDDWDLTRHWAVCRNDKVTYWDSPKPGYGIYPIVTAGAIFVSAPRQIYRQAFDQPVEVLWDTTSDGNTVVGTLGAGDGGACAWLYYPGGHTALQSLFYVAPGESTPVNIVPEGRYRVDSLIVDHQNRVIASLYNLTTGASRLSRYTPGSGWVDLTLQFRLFSQASNYGPVVNQAGHFLFESRTSGSNSTSTLHLYTDQGTRDIITIPDSPSLVEVNNRDDVLDMVTKDSQPGQAYFVPAGGATVHVASLLPDGWSLDWTPRAHMNNNGWVAIAATEDSSRQRGLFIYDGIMTRQVLGGADAVGIGGNNNNFVFDDQGRIYFMKLVDGKMALAYVSETVSQPFVPTTMSLWKRSIRSSPASCPAAMVCAVSRATISRAICFIVIEIPGGPRVRWW